VTRTFGARNKAYAERRRELLVALRPRLARAPKPSLRDLADAASVSIATLRHYFGDRDGIVSAVLEVHRAEGEPFMAMMAAPGRGFRSSIAEAARMIVAGFEQPAVRELHAIGMIEGLSHDVIGPAYLRHTLEPALSSIEARLAAHIARGQMRAADPRVAALELFAPIFVAALHQQPLGGHAVRLLHLQAIADSVVAGFVARYGRATRRARAGTGSRRAR
jgi:AcrR family transcriptional regulator